MTANSEIAMIRAITDRQEIHDQLLRYCRGVDRQDTALMGSVFHPGAINDGGSPSPATELVNRVGELTPLPRMHCVGNVLIELDGDAAYVESYFIAYSAQDIDGRPHTRMRGGRWLDRFERRGGAWKIAHRRVVDEWARVDEVTQAPHVGGHQGVSGPGDPVYRMRELLAATGIPDESASLTEMLPRRIDFNLDLGEGFGSWSGDNDEKALMALATSANLACGFHAGDPSRMRTAIELAKRHCVAVGAHPGLPDLAGFGRRPLTLTPAEVRDFVTYQVGALQGFLRAARLPLHHVKLHGELSTQCSRDAAAAAAYVEAVAALGDGLPIYTFRGSETWLAAERAGVPAIADFYPDLPMRRDGSMVAPTTRRHGRHEDTTPAFIRKQVLDFLATGSLEAYDGGRVEVVAGTISVHTDGPVAVEMARAVRAGAADAGVELSAELRPEPAEERR
jgi:5-oxoprolinase (ATP-hydrolysing) subunit A